MDNANNLEVWGPDNLVKELNFWTANTDDLFNQTSIFVVYLMPNQPLKVGSSCTI